MLKENWVIFTCVSGHTFGINTESIKENPADTEEVEEDARCPVCLRAAEGIVDRTVLIATNRDDEIALDNFYESFKNEAKTFEDHLATDTEKSLV